MPFGEFTHHFASFGRWMKLNCPTEAKIFMQQQPEIIVYSESALESFIIDGVCLGFINKKRFNQLEQAHNLVQVFPKSKPIELNLDYVIKKKETERLIEKEFKTHLFMTWNNHSRTCVVRS